jgi:hypothetical protein
MTLLLESPDAPLANELSGNHALASGFGIDSEGKAYYQPEGIPTSDAAIVRLLSPPTALVRAEILRGNP